MMSLSIHSTKHPKHGSTHQYLTTNKPKTCICYYYIGETDEIRNKISHKITSKGVSPVRCCLIVPKQEEGGGSCDAWRITLRVVPPFLDSFSLTPLFTDTPCFPSCPSSRTKGRGRMTKPSDDSIHISPSVSTVVVLSSPLLLDRSGPHPSIAIFLVPSFLPIRTFATQLKPPLRSFSCPFRVSGSRTSARRQRVSLFPPVDHARAIQRGLR